MRNYGGKLKRFNLSKKKRLAKGEQFKAVLARAVCMSNGLLRLYMAENDCGYPRLGISVGREWGGAVVRSRLKRVLREVFRQSQDEIPAGFDYLVMLSRSRSDKSDKAERAREVVRRLSFEQARASFLTLVKAAAAKATREE
ncbi:MAG: ribonuclease P protein component [Planctomycetota bacterium]|nr:MAG: ribonuclease P protein component [Planctomycetota bacterium]